MILLEGKLITIFLLKERKSFHENCFKSIIRSDYEEIMNEMCLILK